MTELYKPDQFVSRQVFGSIHKFHVWQWIAAQAPDQSFWQIDIANSMGLASSAISAYVHNLEELQQIERRNPPQPELPVTLDLRAKPYFRLETEFWDTITPWLQTLVTLDEQLRQG